MKALLQQTTTTVDSTRTPRWMALAAACHCHNATEYIPPSNKTQPTDKDVVNYLATVAHEGRREDAYTLLDMRAKFTHEPATLWGPSIIGFGRYHYVYDSGREGGHFLTGFAPRKANMVVYIVPGFEPYDDLLSQLGPYKTGRSCLYLSRLNKIDINTLEEIISQSVGLMKERYSDNVV